MSGGDQGREGSANAPTVSGMKSHRTSRHRFLKSAALLLVLPACGGTVQAGGNDSGRRGSGGSSTATGSTQGAAGSGARIAVGGAGVTGSAGTAGDCSPGLTRCRSGCVDLSSDGDHCGSCSSSCVTGASCDHGTCRSPGTDPNGCTAGLTFCSSFHQCLDLQSNPFTCGSCGTPCLNGERCAGGVCQAGTCVEGTACQGPDGSFHCSTLQSDASNCGACNHVCPGGQSCSGGQCAPISCGGLAYCGDAGCQDTQSDALHCGGCDTTCTGGKVFDYYGAYTCTQGTCACAPLANPCGKGCATDFWYCPPLDFQGTPTNLCLQLARNSYERCACNGCLAEVQACSASPSCVNSMDCSLKKLCVGCQTPFEACSDIAQGTTDPLADKLQACLNAQCASP
jgi:hypothetical protein